MRIRLGFVSNSSSESFLVYGAKVDGKVVTEEIWEQIHKRGLIVEYTPDWDDRYVGKSWDSIGDDQTGKEFKEDIEAKITEIFGDGFKCHTHSAAWYNG